MRKPRPSPPRRAPSPLRRLPALGPRLDALTARGLMLLARGYRLLLSPLLGPRCRHLPTCSEYCLEALARHGAWRGTRLTLGRLLRCHPWGSSGYDPVP